MVVIKGVEHKFPRHPSKKQLMSGIVIEMKQVAIVGFKFMALGLEQHQKTRPL